MSDDEGLRRFEHEFDLGCSEEEIDRFREFISDMGSV